MKKVNIISQVLGFLFVLSCGGNQESIIAGAPIIPQMPSQKPEDNIINKNNSFQEHQGFKLNYLGEFSNDFYPVTLALVKNLAQYNVISLDKEKDFYAKAGGVLSNEDLETLIKGKAKYYNWSIEVDSPDMKNGRFENTKKMIRELELNEIKTYPPSPQKSSESTEKKIQTFPLSESNDQDIHVLIKKKLDLELCYKQKLDRDGLFIEYHKKANINIFHSVEVLKCDDAWAVAIKSAMKSGEFVIHKTANFNDLKKNRNTKTYDINALNNEISSFGKKELPPWLLKSNGNKMFRLPKMDFKAEIEDNTTDIYPKIADEDIDYVKTTVVVEVKTDYEGVKVSAEIKMGLGNECGFVSIGDEKFFVDFTEVSQLLLDIETEDGKNIISVPIKKDENKFGKKYTLNPPIS